jgi:NADPH:quinone reductase-like Zn-dependent oxidoreductase
MKAMVLTKFGPPEVLQLQEVGPPVPKEHDVLIRIQATTVTAGDAELRGLRLPFVLRPLIRLYARFGRPRPLILGQELAGEVAAIGQAVTRFRTGDQVCAWTGLALGTYAEYTCVPEHGVLAHKPSNMTYEEAAPLGVGGLEATYFLRRAQLQPGHRVLIVGAGGSIGTYAVQLARYFGAEVTGVDRLEKLEMLRTMGATHVFDYLHEDFTQRGETYDVIFDVIGKSPFARSIRALRPHGRYLLGNPGLSQRVRAPLRALRSGKHIIARPDRSSSESLADFQFLKELIEAGSIRSVLDRSYLLEQTAEAHRYVDSGQKQGHVVITVGERG